MDQTSRELYDVLEELERRKKYNKLKYLFPIDGEYNRFKYGHALEFMKAGHDWRQRLFCAANRVGKTFTCGTEIAYHATGRYEYFEQGEEKWEGRRFNEPVVIWVVGKSTNQSN